MGCIRCVVGALAAGAAHRGCDDACAPARRAALGCRAAPWPDAGLINRFLSYNRRVFSFSRGLYQNYLAASHGLVFWRKTRLRWQALAACKTLASKQAEQPELQRCFYELSRAHRSSGAAEYSIVLSRQPLATRRRTAPHPTVKRWSCSREGPRRYARNATRRNRTTRARCGRAGSSAQTNQIQNKTRTH